MMFIFICIISTIVAAICWCWWAFGAAGEYPGRVLGIAIAAIVMALLTAWASREEL